MYSSSLKVHTKNTIFSFCYIHLIIVRTLNLRVVTMVTVDKFEAQWFTKCVSDNQKGNMVR